MGRERQMAIVQNDIWELAVASGLFSADRCERYRRAYDKAQGTATPGTATTLATWLVAQRVLSKYQARVLLSGLPGPFVYGDYVVRDRKAAGRLAGLFRAKHRPTGHPVMLLFLSGERLSDPSALAALRQRLAAATVLRGPHLCRVYQWVELDDFKFVVLQDLRGEPAAERVAQQGPLPIREACGIVYQAALGLLRWHETGRAHDEIRPDNLWLSSSGLTQLLSFPLDRDPLGGKAPPEVELGNADFWAPERFLADTAPTTRGDVYSLGCTLYFLLTGGVPFPGGDLDDKHVRHTHEEPEAIDKVRPSIPATLAHLVGYTLAKDPTNRYRHAAAVAKALKPFAGEISSETSSAALPTKAAFEKWLHEQLPEPPKETVAVPNDSAVHDQSSVAARPLRADAPAVDVQAPLITDRLPDVTVTTRARAGGGAKRMLFRLGLVIGSAAILIAAVIFLLNVPRNGTSDSSAQQQGESTTDPDGAALVEPTPGDLPESASTVAPRRVEFIRPLQEPLWSSPTTGAPLDLRFLPDGGQLFFAWRPADLLVHPEGAKLLSLPGSIGSLMNDTLVDWCGVPLEDMEQIVVTLFAGTGDDAIAAVVRTRSALDRDAWLARLNHPAPQFHEATGDTFYRGDGWVYYSPGAPHERLVAIVPDEPAAIDSLFDNRQDAAPLRRDMESLLQSSDDERHISLLFAPRHLFAGGQWLFSAEAAVLKSPLRRFFAGDTQAALLSLHVDESLFVELRMVGSGDVPTVTLAGRFSEQIARLPLDVEDYVVGLSPSAYSRRVLLRYPQMVHLLSGYARTGTEDQQVVIRGVLPARAAHNLLLGSHLAMLESPGAAIATTGDGPAVVNSAQTVAEKLRRNITLTFDRNTLEHCLELFADEIGVPVEILGRDLQLEGITKNQSFGLDQRNQPAADVLKRILDLANPDGKLVYVIKPSADGGGDMLFITTRAAAAGRGDTLPPELMEAD